MIEKFTEEELLQIKKDLGLICDRNKMRKDVIKDDYERLSLFGSLTGEVNKGICIICDYTLHNYEVKRRRRNSISEYTLRHDDEIIAEWVHPKNHITYYDVIGNSTERATKYLLPGVDEDKYSAMYHEIVDIIERYKI